MTMPFDETRWQRIADAIDGWNSSNTAAIFRNILREELGWRVSKTQPKPKPLSDLLLKAVAECFGLKVVEQPSDQQAQITNAINRVQTCLLPLLVDEDNKMRNNTLNADVMAQLILQTDWNFIDPLSLMRKSPVSVQNFLQCLAAEPNTRWANFSGRRIMSVISQAYNRAAKMQRDEGQKLLKEGESVEKIVITMQRYLRKDVIKENIANR